MKTIILAGGFGIRLSEYTENIPKPMVPIGGRPILWHIMSHYARHGYKDFNLALGYKAELVKEYFLQYRSLNSDFTIDLNSGSLDYHQTDNVDWQVTLVNTGLNSLTGGRVKRMQEFVGNEPFMFTYGDGLSNIDIAKLIEFHKSHGKLVTVTAVHPSARFGELDLDDSRVTTFKEKPQTGKGWINGGFFVAQPEFFDYIEGDHTILEQEPLERVAAEGQLMAFKHDGYWQCMDTKRDRDSLEELWASGTPPWLG